MFQKAEESETEGNERGKSCLFQSVVTMFSNSDYETSSVKHTLKFPFTLGVGEEKTGFLLFKKHQYVKA